ncbi:MAG TPA: hypothetical protein VMT61_15485 [Candidatus Binataceae bacterium]|nr:hypothetical protein [Candidatus Binataceae bacterium]
MDSAGNLYVADMESNRVLEYDSPLTTGVIAASHVFGQQGNFTTRFCNGADASTISADSLCLYGTSGTLSLSGVAVDKSDNLWVADQQNHRILEYVSPLTTDTTADFVLGQNGSFTANSCDSAGFGTAPSSGTLCYPTDVAVDTSERVLVADFFNNRVLAFDQVPPTPTPSGATPEASPTAMPPAICPTSTPTPTLTPTPTPTATPVSAMLRAVPKSLIFARTFVGSSSKSKTIKIYNLKGENKHRSVPVQIEMISSDSSAFTETNDCPLSLSVGAACSISVTFKPNVATRQSGAVLVTDNAKGEPQSVFLTGYGKQPH